MVPLLLNFLVTFLLPPFLVILGVILVLASLGKSLGIRRLYVKLLLNVFEFAGAVKSEQKAAKRGQGRKISFMIEEDSDSECDELSAISKTFAKPSEVLQPGQKELLSNGHVGDDHLDSDERDMNYRRQKILQYGRESRHNVISRRDNLILSPDKPPTLQEEMEDVTDHHAPDANSKGYLAGKPVSASTFQREFELDDVLEYIKTGIGSIIEDEVTQRFDSEELKNWNLLTRTSQSFEFVSLKLTIVWIIGFFVRYCILLPLRVCILVVAIVYLLLVTSVISLIPSVRIRSFTYNWAALTCFRILARSWSAVIDFHNKEYRPKTDGICVANHTTPIDVVILSCDKTYALVGQRHGGLFGFIQNALERAAAHIWFERSEVKDRLLVAKRLKDHVEDPTKLPILIFPEGTCINNTSVMQFKKGSFEVGGIVYPVAIKYDPKFGDAFWNSSKYGMLTYFYMMMTSWAIVCDVWYLPPMIRGEGENSVDFANRVKAEIARQGGLVDLTWDGNLKRQSVKSEWKAKQQEEFSRRFKTE